MKIFEHLTQLDNAVGFYRKGIIAILIVCALLMTAMYIHTESRILQATSSAYILNQDGDVAIATRIRAADFRKIEAEAHVRLFIMLFFDIDKYTCEQRISSTYALGNSSIYALKQRFDKDNWFTNMRQYNISQSVQITDLKCVAEEPLTVDAIFTVTITSEVHTKPQVYELSITFFLEQTKERTRENPHALAITKIDFKNFNLKQ